MIVFAKNRLHQTFETSYNRNSLLKKLKLFFSRPISTTSILPFSHSATTRSFPYGDPFCQQQRLKRMLRACSNNPSLDATKSLHALVVTLGSASDQPIFLYNNIVSLYLSIDDLRLARKVFDEMPQKTVVSYNTMLCGYSRSGHTERAWEVFDEMRRCGFSPTQFTFGGLLSCEGVDVSEGLQLYALIMKLGLICYDAVSGTALLGFFGRCSLLSEAIHLFKELPVKNLVTWNSIISLLGQYGFAEECMFFLRELMKVQTYLSESSVVGVLTGFVGEEGLEWGNQLHGLVIKHGLDCKATVLNSLINMYVKCSGIDQAEEMFQNAHARDVVSWNSIFRALTKSERAGLVLELYIKMALDEVFPNQTTFVSVINSCASLQTLTYGQLIHGKVIISGSERNVFVGSALVDFYAKCGRMEDAHCCFNEINEKNVVSWNSLISGYSSKCSRTSLMLLLEMLQLGCHPNEYSFSAILKSTTALEMQQLHSFIIKMGYHRNDHVLGVLITSYAKNNLIADALNFATDFLAPLPVVPSNIVAGIYNRIGQYCETQNLFSVLEEPDRVSWNILIAACARNGDYQEAFELFKHMQIDKRFPDEYTLVTILNLCIKLCNLALGSSIHGLLIKTNLMCFDTFVCNVLMDMYGKCGAAESSLQIFNSIAHRNLITWTILISALGLNGYPSEALERFSEMVLHGFRPDGVAFSAILSACRHGGFVKEGMELLNQMSVGYGVEPQMEHYHCVVDMLSRYGHLKDAEKLISRMPFPPNALIWRSFHEGCKRKRTAGDKKLYSSSVIYLELVNSLQALRSLEFSRTMSRAIPSVAHN